MSRKLPDTFFARSELVDRELTAAVIGSFYEVYNTLGYGFLELVYRRALVCELRARGLDVAEEVSAIVRYKGIEAGIYRLDLLVGRRVVVEIKATESLHQSAKRQLLNYLRVTSLEVGLLLHFGREAQFFRVVSSLPPRSNVGSGEP